MTNQELNIKVCGPKDMFTEDTLKLSLTSHAAAINPIGWKDLWLLSPFSLVKGRVIVPGMKGKTSKTVENVWQFLKVWQGEEQWDKETALAAFDSDCAMRFPRGKGAKHRGLFWGETGEILDLVVGRFRIYFKAYCQMLSMPDRQEIINRIRIEAQKRPVVIWDYDSYDFEKEGLSKLFETIKYTQRSFAHAFICEMAIRNQLSEFENFNLELL